MGGRLAVCDGCGRAMTAGALRAWFHSEDAPIAFTFHMTVRAVQVRLCADCHAAALAEETAWQAPTRRTTMVIAALLMAIAVISLADLRFWPRVFRFFNGPSTQELIAERNLWAAPEPWPTRSPFDRPANATGPR
jgi:hypothetical protein